VGRALEEHFSPVLGEPFGIELLALFIEPEPGRRSKWARSTRSTA